MRIEKLWIVRDPTAESTLDDVLSGVPVDRLPYLVLGTGAQVWRDENTTLYTEKSEALRDALARLAGVGK